MSDVTKLLSAIQDGEESAVQELMTVVYGELRRLAAAKMAKEKPGHTLDATGLVHEVFLRLMPDSKRTPHGSLRFENSRHFFAAAAEAMRRILIERARQRRGQRRGGNRQRIEMTAEMMASPAQDERLIALDEALDRFAEREPQKAELVKLRWFAGLTREQLAETLNIPLSKVDRSWAYARAWLKIELSEEKFSDS